MSASANGHWSGRTLLVFGGRGQVGHAIGGLLPPDGWRLVMVGRGEADITRIDEVKRLVGKIEPAVIVNAAAFTAVDDAESQPEAADRVNQLGAAIVAGTAHQAGAPIIHLSTDYVFDGERSQPLRESDPVRPLSVYGTTKEAGERAVRRANARHVILRTSWVFGTHGKNFVKTMLKLGAERPSLRIVADQYGCPTAATDLAQAIWTIAIQLGSPALGSFGTFHFAGHGVTTWFDFAGRIFDDLVLRGHQTPKLEPIPTHAYPTPARRPAYSVLDCDKIRTVYGIVPPSWHDGLAACIQTLSTPIGKQQRRGVAA